jgi:hypothetical protein
MASTRSSVLLSQSFTKVFSLLVVLVTGSKDVQAGIEEGTLFWRNAVGVLDPSITKAVWLYPDHCTQRSVSLCLTSIESLYNVPETTRFQHTVVSAEYI